MQRFSQQHKHSMSDEAWFELSALLVRSTPGIKSRLVNTLRNIGPDEAERWLDHYNNPAKYDAQHVFQSNSNQFVYSSDNALGYYSNVSGGNRYYVGRPHTKLTIQFVDNEEDFEKMIEVLKVSDLGAVLF